MHKKATSPLTSWIEIGPCWSAFLKNCTKVISRSDSRKSEGAFWSVENKWENIWDEWRELWGTPGGTVFAKTQLKCPMVDKTRWSALFGVLPVDRTCPLFTINKSWLYLCWCPPPTPDLFYYFRPGPSNISSPPLEARTFPIQMGVCVCVCVEITMQRHVWTSPCSLEISIFINERLTHRFLPVLFAWPPSPPPKKKA